MEEQLCPDLSSLNRDNRPELGSNHKGIALDVTANDCMFLLPCVLALQALLSLAAKPSLHLHNVLLEQAVELQPPRLSQTLEHIFFAAHATCNEGA